MPWDRSRPGGGKVNPKYRSKEHRDARAQHMAELRRVGSGLCAEIVCRYPSRVITPSMRLHLCHDRATGAVLGLGHAKCNVSEAGRHARARQTVTRLQW